MQQVDVAAWRLRVTGEVANPLQLTEDDVLDMPWVERTYAMNCVTGWSATRTWRGVELSRLLTMAGARGDWGHADVRSTSGYHWDHRRSDLVLAGTLLCTHVNGVRLNDAHGVPLRLMIPGTVGESNIKWVDGIDVRRGAPQLYLAEHVDFSNPTVTGPLLPADPPGTPRETPPPRRRDPGHGRGPRRQCSRCSLGDWIDRLAVRPPLMAAPSIVLPPTIFLPVMSTTAASVHCGTSQPASYCRTGTS